MNDWIAKNEFLTKAEQQNNALIVYDFFNRNGWSINAIAAILGNMEKESTINPGIWEGRTNDPQAFKDKYGYTPGFGIVQWTPYTKYTNWAGEGSTTGNWNKQLERIIWELENPVAGDQYYPTKNYPETFKEFSVSTKSAYYLAGAFLYNYERPKKPNADERGKMADAWLEFLNSAELPKPPKVPIWLLFKLNSRR